MSCDVCGVCCFIRCAVCVLSWVCSPYLCVCGCLLVFAVVIP